MTRKPLRIIGFGHQRYRGKDTAAAYLADQYGYAHDAFAHSLKEGLGRGIFGLTDDQLYGDLKEVTDAFWGLTPRDILQRGGTEAMRRTFGEDIWVKTLLRRAHHRNVSTVIADVRFVSEAEAIKTDGGLVVRIDRDIAYDPDIDTHQSEVDLLAYKGWNCIINNNGTLEELYHKLDMFMRDFRGS